MNPQNQTDETNQPSDSAGRSSALPPTGGPVSSLPSVTPGQTQYTEVTLPNEAEDTDLIEKEWVERAKQIVEHTREDPYEQQRALSQMKADYLKKRYNKDIKVADD